MEFRVGSVTSPELEFLNNLWARNRVGIGLSYRPTRLHRLAEFIPWNRFLDSMFSTLKNIGTGPTDSIWIMFQCLMTTFTRTLLLSYSLKGTVQLKEIGLIVLPLDWKVRVFFPKGSLLFNFQPECLKGVQAKALSTQINLITNCFGGRQVWNAFFPLAGENHDKMRQNAAYPDSHFRESPPPISKQNRCCSCIFYIQVGCMVSITGWQT